MEKELFITVANYNLSDNADKYLEAIKNTPKTPKYFYDYARWLYPGLIFKLGMAKFPPGSASKVLYDRKAFSEADRFTKAELNDFEQRRIRFINVMDQITSDKPLFDIEGINMILETAKQLTQDEIFKIENGEVTKKEAALYPWTQKGKQSIIKTEESGRVRLIYDVLNPLLNLACHGLSAFLADRKRDRIKKCLICNQFFIADDLRQKKCKSEICFTQYKRTQKRLQRENNPVKYL